MQRKKIHKNILTQETLVKVQGLRIGATSPSNPSRCKKKPKPLAPSSAKRITVKIPRIPYNPWLLRARRSPKPSPPTKVGFLYKILVSDLRKDPARNISSDKRRGCFNLQTLSLVIPRAFRKKNSQESLRGFTQGARLHGSSVREVVAAVASGFQYCKGLPAVQFQRTLCST